MRAIQLRKDVGVQQVARLEHAVAQAEDRADRMEAELADVRSRLSRQAGRREGGAAPAGYGEVSSTTEFPQDAAPSLALLKMPLDQGDQEAADRIVAEAVALAMKVGAVLPLPVLLCCLRQFYIGPAHSKILHSCLLLNIPEPHWDVHLRDMQAQAQCEEAERRCKAALSATAAAHSQVEHYKSEALRAEQHAREQAMLASHWQSERHSIEADLQAELDSLAERQLQLLDHATESDAKVAELEEQLRCRVDAGSKKVAELEAQLKQQVAVRDRKCNPT